MNPTVSALIPGLIVGLGAAVILFQFAPRFVRVSDALSRLGELSITPTTATDQASRRPLDRAGTWLAGHAPGIPLFSAPVAELDLLDIPVPRFNAAKIRYALIGFTLPIFIPVLFQLILGQPFLLPLILSPVMALIFWVMPDTQVRANAKKARREFTRFITVYLQLVAVSLLGVITVDNALKNAASVSDSWVFQRIRREYEAAELTRTSKWDALENLGRAVGIPAMVDMSRTLKLSEARVGLRDQLIASHDMLRAQVLADDRADAEKGTARMAGPVYASMVPILLLLIAPPILQLTNL